MMIINQKLNEDILNFSHIMSGKLLEEGRLNDDDQSRAAGCIIVYGGKLLLQHRSLNSVHGGTWACFGGSAKLNENFKQAMYREVEEECGIGKNDMYSVVPLGRFDAPNFTFFTFISKGKEILDIINLDQESLGYGLFTFSETMKLNLLPNFKETLLVYSDKINEFCNDTIDDEIMPTVSNNPNHYYVNIAKDSNPSRFVQDVEFKADNYQHILNRGE